MPNAKYYLSILVHLVEQQAKAIRSHTFLNDEVGEYHGQMSPPVDFYSEVIFFQPFTVVRFTLYY